jgi:putative membrane protein
MMGSYGGYGGYPGMMSGYGFNPMGGILTIIFWGLIIAGIALVAVWLARGDDHRGMHPGSSESALQILKTRYAKGEITKEQFESIKRDLGE